MDVVGASLVGDPRDAFTLTERATRCGGGQDVPDLTHLLEVLVPTMRLELPASENEVEQRLLEELKRSGSSVLVAQGKCTKQ